MRARERVSVGDRIRQQAIPLVSKFRTNGCYLVRVLKISSWSKCKRYEGNAARRDGDKQRASFESRRVYGVAGGGYRLRNPPDRFSSIFKLLGDVDDHDSVLRLCVQGDFFFFLIKRSFYSLRRVNICVFKVLSE